MTNKNCRFEYLTRIQQICGLLFYLCLGVLHAQNKQSLIFFFSGGYGQPVGKFKEDYRGKGKVMVRSYSNHPSNPSQIYVPNQTGTAIPGSNWRAEIAYLFWKKFGTTISYCTTENSSFTVDPTQFISPHQDFSHGAGWALYPSANKLGLWKTENFLTGITWHLDFLKFFFLRLKIAAGLQKVESPGFNVIGDASYWSGSGGGEYFKESYEQSSLKSKCFATSMGFDLNVRLKYGFTLSLDMNYLVSVPKFNGEIISNYYNYTSGFQVTNHTPTSFKDKINLLLINGGISYELN